MPDLCGTNDMRYKRKEVPKPDYPCCNWSEVKQTAPHQLHCPSLPRLRLFKNSTEYLHKWMKVQDTEPTMCAIICFYIRGKGQKIRQDDPYLIREISSIAKSQDIIGWDNMIGGQIVRHCSHWESYYHKKGTPSKPGIKWTRSFI